MAFVDRFRGRRLGLRARIALAFALGALLLAVILAGTTYALTRSALVRQRDTAAVRQVYDNARRANEALQSNPPSALNVVSNLQTPGSRPLLWYRDNWITRNSEYDSRSLPAALRERVNDERRPSRMVYSLESRPVLAVGIPLPDGATAYYEIVALDQLSSTLNSVGVSLIGASVLTFSLGLLLGAWVSARAVRPLADAALAAQALAGGRLDTRIDPTEDRDLGLLATAFNDMAAALQQRVERDARFASDVSHELRSPLMTLAASAEVLEGRRDELPEKAQVALDLLVADVERFRSLVEDLLEISRFDAGAVRLHREELLAAELVRQAVSVSSLRDAPVLVNPRAENLVILGDKRRLARVVANLVDNARLHGGGDVEVHVSASEEEPPGHVLIAFEDHGPGVPPEDRHLVFERFARGGSAGRRSTTEGAGLGLALVDEHVRLHGGRVWVEDRLDGQPGARFVIELPTEEP